MQNNSYATAVERKKKALFVPFVVLGDPDRKKSVEIVRTLVENGADALELGFPFSDPPADGPVIQAADVRALAAGITVDDCFAILTEIRSFTSIPVGLLLYYNLILQRGVDNFYRDCAASGVTSVLIADLPLEHAEEVLPFAKKHGIAPVFLVSEVTSDERLQKIAAIAEAYLYVVSYVGVTGVASNIFEENIAKTIGRARKQTSLPLFVGFGINTIEQAQAAARAGADGVIVGSRIVCAIPDIQRIRNICTEFSSLLL